MKIVLDIPDENMANNLIWLLEKLQNSTVMRLETLTNDASIEAGSYSDDYVQEHWLDFIMGTTGSDYYKSESYELDRGKYLLEKYS